MRPDEAMPLSMTCLSSQFSAERILLAAVRVMETVIPTCRFHDRNQVAGNVMRRARPPGLACVDGGDKSGEGSKHLTQPQALAVRHVSSQFRDQCETAVGPKLREKGRHRVPHGAGKRLECRLDGLVKARAARRLIPVGRLQSG